MTPTLRLGRIFGIEVGINWSLLFIFVLVAWSLTSTLPTAVPGRPLTEYWIAGVAGAIVFYACLLAHELSHSLVARRLGVRVAGITLWLFGGVSRFEGEPSQASAEAAITAAGPLASLVVAGICFVLAAAIGTSGSLALVGALLSWLAGINLLLALFNLIPAFPLDGGRLLSSLLWWRSGSRRSGVHQAVRVGRLFAYGMIGLGFIELVLGGVFNGIWIAFIGWFLLSAASAEERGAEQRELLRNVPVSAAMTAPVVTVPDWLTVEQLLASIAPTHRFTTYPLHDRDGNLTGVVRLRDVLAHRSPAQLASRLSEVADPPATMPRTRPDEDLAAMIDRVGEDLQRRVLVYDGDQLVGIVSPADIARLLTLRAAVPTRGAG